MHRNYLFLSVVAIFLLTFHSNYTIGQNNEKKEDTNTKFSNTIIKDKISEFGNVNGVTSDQLKEYLFHIASDEMRGRNTPSKELDLTAKFLSDNLSEWGLKPAGENKTFLQKFSIKSSLLIKNKTIAFLSNKQLKLGDEYIAFNQPGKGSGSMIFVSYGVMVKKKNIDPYKGLDVKDKVLIVISGLPRGVTKSDLSGEIGVDYDLAVHYAATHGAKGVILIPTKTFLENWKHNATAMLNQPLWHPVFRNNEYVKAPYIAVNETIAEQLFKDEKFNYKTIEKQMRSGDYLESFALNKDKLMSFEVGVTYQEAAVYNVVGILEGSDPVLKNEYVAIGAHYDHVGTNCPPIGNDNICNGADDNGSGTAAVLAIAKAMSQGPRPKRSILFVWFAGEERGLWGSEFITENSPVPLSSIVAFFNLEMIGRSRKSDDNNPYNADLSGPNEIYVVGSKMLSTEFGELSESVNKSYLKMKFNYRYDDPNDKEKVFYRSDHFYYAQKGIPVIFYFSGGHEDYHQATDSADKIDYQKMQRVTRTIFATLWKSANIEKRFVIDKQLPKMNSMYK